MSLDVHTISMMDGSSPLSNPDRLKIGLLTGVAVPVPGGGEMTGGVVDAVGSGYTSIPTGVAAGGTGGTIAASMAIATTAEAAAGTSYAPGDTVTLTGGTASQQGIAEVLTTKAVAAPAVAAGGANYAVNDQITLQNGLVVQVATVSSGAVATVTVLNGGSFNANNTTAGGLTQVSTTGSGSGATFTMTAAKYGVNTYSVQNGGAYSALPASPVSQGSTSGSGTGFQLTISTWQLEAFTATGGVNYQDGAAVAFSGGGGSGAQGHITTAPIGDDVTIPVSFGNAMPAAYNVQVTTNGPALVTVTDKTNSGFNVNLAPSASGQPIGASTVDILVLA